MDSIPYWSIDEDEDEDPLRVDEPVAAGSTMETVIVPASSEPTPSFCIKREPTVYSGEIPSSSSVDNVSIDIKKEPFVYRNEDIPSSSSIDDAMFRERAYYQHSYSQQSYSVESEEKTGILPIRLFMCKRCGNPYEMVCRSNLMIRGYCNECLYVDEKFDKSHVNYGKDVKKTNTILCDVPVMCSFCGKYLSRETLHEHEKQRKVCEICDKNFCTLNDLESHLASHNFNSFDANGDHLKKEIMCHEKNKSFQVNDISVSFINSDDVFRKKVPEKPKEEKHCRKLSKTNKADHVSKVKCGICTKMVLKESFEDHMKEHNQIFSSLNDRIPVSKVGVFETKSIPDSKEDKNDIVKKTFCQYKYFCDHCKLDLDNLNSLNEHLESDVHVNMIVCIVGSSLSCKLCKNNFSSIEDIKSHLIEFDHIIKYHIKKNFSDIFGCKVCDKFFVNELDLLTHELFKDDCKIDLKNNNSFKRSLPSGNEVKISQRHKNVIKKSKTINRRYNLARTCKTCKKSFLSAASLKKHVASLRHESYFTKKETKDTSRRKICTSNSVQGNSNGNEILPNRGIKETSSNNNLSVGHSVNETSDPNRNFICTVCSRCFNSLTSLKKHATFFKHNLKIPNNDSNPNDSDKLSQPNNKSNSVSTAMQRGSSKDKSDLSKNFSQQKTLFRCSYCPKTFKDDNHRRQHMKVHRKGQTVRKNIICKICNLKPETFGDLLHHFCTADHNLSCIVDVKCIYCKKKFNSLILYVRHSSRKSHLEACMDSNYENLHCEWCDVKCSTISDFKDHIISKSHLANYVKKNYVISKNKRNCILSKNKVMGKSNLSVANYLNIECSHCAVIFRSLTLYKQHCQEFNVSGDPVYKCAKCKIKFGTLQTLINHCSLFHIKKT